MSEEMRGDALSEMESSGQVRENMRNEIDSLRASLSRAEADLSHEHEISLKWHRENMELAAGNVELRGQVDELEAAHVAVIEAHKRQRLIAEKAEAENARLREALSRIVGWAINIFQAQDVARAALSPVAKEPGKGGANG